MEINIPQWNMVTGLFIEAACKAQSNPNPNKTAGFLTIGIDNFSERHIIQIGNPATDKLDKYLRLSQEKAYRLYADWLRDPINTFSSWQSRQPEIDRWGGAVLFAPSGYSRQSPSCDIVSFSGLPEIVDESISMRLGLHFGLSSDISEFVDRVTRISGNKVFREMYDVR